MNNLVQPSLIEPQEVALRYTPLDRGNWDFTNLAHIAAQDLLYPDLFGVPRENIDFGEMERNQVNQFLDGQMAIDRNIRVSFPEYPRHPLEFSVQERFRKPQYANFRDVTITRDNLNTGLPSEFYKFHAQIFVYGYFDQTDNNFIEVVALDTVAIRLGIVFDLIGKDDNGDNPRSNQTFTSITIDDCRNHAGYVICRWLNNQLVESIRLRS